MITRIVTSLFGWLMGLLVARGSKPARVFLAVEELEVRTLPTTFYWVGPDPNNPAGDYKWSTAGNWNTAIGVEATRAPGLDANITDDAVTFGGILPAQAQNCYLDTDAGVATVYLSGQNTLYLQGPGQNGELPHEWWTPS